VAEDYVPLSVNAEDIDSGYTTTSSGGGSWIDDVLGAFGTTPGKLLDTLGPMAFNYGISQIFPGLTDTQRAMAGIKVVSLSMTCCASVFRVLMTR
jgi:hypothetical protein